MTPQDTDNAANILKAILDFVGEAEGNVIEHHFYGYKVCINVSREYKRGTTHYGNSLTECLEKAGIKVEPLKSQSNLVGEIGDSGLLIGGMYRLNDRVLMCLADHAEKGIWMTDPALPVKFSAKKNSDRLKNWYGDRQKFDLEGWVLESDIEG